MKWFNNIKRKINNLLFQEHEFISCYPDSRDYRDLSAPEYKGEELPENFDLTDQMTPVRYQGGEGTCVGFSSVVGMREYHIKKQENKEILLSPRYLYFNCKLIDGMPNVMGTNIRSAMKVLYDNGVCLEEEWKYKPFQQDKPRSDNTATKYKISKYMRINNSVYDIKTCLYSFGPCVAGINAHSGWNKYRMESTGMIPDPISGNVFRGGGHAVCLVGWDDSMRMFKFKNSWEGNLKKMWGSNGYGWVSYNYIEKHTNDIWIGV